jgi:hypothetical protein
LVTGVLPEEQVQIKTVTMVVIHHSQILRWEMVLMQKVVVGEGVQVQMALRILRVFLVAPAGGVVGFSLVVAPV